MLLIGFFILCIFVFVLIIGLNYWVIGSTKKQIVKIEDIKNKNEYDCIVVLGAGVRGERPTDMLRDRIIVGTELYKNECAPKIIMSGDHGKTNYDEVNVMKKQAIDAGVESSDIFMDHAGFSTYETMYRVKEIFDAKKIIIVTQEYHLYRSIYVAQKLGLEAIGVSADLMYYAGQQGRDLREILARDKDFFQCIIKPKPTYLGEKIPVTGDGDVTNDKEI